MRWLQQMFTCRRYDELSESIREHLDEKIVDLMDSGMTREQAERTAHSEFGNVTVIKERSREIWHWQWLESLLRDVRHVLRGPGRSPGFTFAVIVTLAVGIGANTAVFSVINCVLIQPLAPVTFTVVLVFLDVAAVFASYVPARRTSSKRG